MQRRVSYFDVEWNRRSRKGRLRITFDDRKFEDIESLDAGELTLLTGVLRQGKVVYWDPQRQTLSTLPDLVDDSE